MDLCDKSASNIGIQQAQSQSLSQTNVNTKQIVQENQNNQDINAIRRKKNFARRF